MNWFLWLLSKGVFGVRILLLLTRVTKTINFDYTFLIILKNNNKNKIICPEKDVFS